MIYRCEQCGKELPTGYPTYIVEIRRKPRRYQPMYGRHYQETKLIDLEVCEECKNKILSGFHM